eukprot:GFYU01003799.1.p1 GENE.GFYU01003799.1~~GFYU01003799.1.p1  ORF type:complete len:687 (-),score=239.15 GFYU01003799.1:170-2230(-)
MATRYSALDPRVTQEQLKRQEAYDYNTDDDEDDYDEEPIEYNDGSKNCILVNNLPQVPPEKADKLKAVIKKIYTQVGRIVQDGITMPMDDKKKLSKGFAFVEFNTAEEAEKAVMQTDGYKLDKSHVFKVLTFEAFEKFMEVPDDYEAPPPQEYKEREDLLSWLRDSTSLTDARARDQYVVRSGDQTEVHWNEGYEAPELAYGRKNWTETFVVWSPKGTFLATFHQQGIALWGGQSWNRLARFGHPGVMMIAFSPCENYMVTFNGYEGDDPNAPEPIIIWDARSGAKLRGFPNVKEQANTAWPFFRWSPDDKYFARIQDETIKVFETPSMKLLDKKSISVPGIQDFCWSPTDNILAYWQPEKGNSPARVSLMEIPSRVEVRTKNLFNVNDCKMFWHNDGDFLCVKVDRHTKTKKSTYTNFELFRVHEKNIPVEVLEMKDAVHAFAWEPHGVRFAVIHGELPRPDISFFSMEKQSTGKIKEVGKVEKKSVNCLFWSPKGNYIVMAGLKTLNGGLEFWDIGEFEQLAADEHFMATDVEWDPTGRYVMTYVSQFRHQLENGYFLWDFKGRCVQKFPKDKLYHVAWRPRPPTLLSKDQEKEVKKNLKTYSRKYDLLDRQKQDQQDSAFQSARKALTADFSALDQEHKRIYEEEREARRELRGGYASDDDDQWEEVEQLVEEVLETKEEIQK